MLQGREREIFQNESYQTTSRVVNVWKNPDLFSFIIHIRQPPTMCFSNIIFIVHYTFVTKIIILNTTALRNRLISCTAKYSSKYQEYLHSNTTIPHFFLKLVSDNLGLFSDYPNICFILSCITLSNTILRSLKSFPQLIAS